MDYVTRQFINLTKKVRKESRKFLIELRDSIEKHTQAAEKAANAQQKHAEANEFILAKISEQATPARKDKTREPSHSPIEWIKLAVSIGTLFVVAAYTALTAYQLIQLKVSADAAKSAADTAAKQLEMSERPWIKVKLVSHGPFTFSSSGYANLGLQFALKNVGHSVAAGVTIETRMFPVLGNEVFTKSIEHQKEVCAIARERKIDPQGLAGGALSLFPEDESPSPYTVDVAIDKPSIDSTIFRKDRFFPGSQEIYPIVVGCADYQFTFESGHHQTGFIYEVRQLNPADRFHPMLIIVGRNVDAPKLLVDRYFFGGFWAN